MLINRWFFKYLRVIFWLTFCALYWFLNDEYPYKDFDFFKTDLFIIAMPIIVFLLASFVKNIKIIFWLWIALLVLLICLYLEKYVI